MRADPHPHDETGRDAEAGEAWMGDKDAVAPPSGSLGNEIGAVEAPRGRSPDNPPLEHRLPDTDLDMAGLRAATLTPSSRRSTAGAPPRGVSLLLRQIRIADLRTNGSAGRSRSSLLPTSGLAGRHCSPLPGMIVQNPFARDVTE